MLTVLASGKYFIQVILSMASFMSVAPDLPQSECSQSCEMLTTACICKSQQALSHNACVRMKAEE